MPLLPFLYYAIGFISRDQRTAGCAEAVLMFGDLFSLLPYLLRLSRSFLRGFS